MEFGIETELNRRVRTILIDTNSEKFKGCEI